MLSLYLHMWRLHALISGLSSLGARPGWGHVVVVLGKTMYSHNASLHPGVPLGTSEFNADVNPVLQTFSVTDHFPWSLDRLDTEMRFENYPRALPVQKVV